MSAVPPAPEASDSRKAMLMLRNEGVVHRLWRRIVERPRWDAFDGFIVGHDAAEGDWGGIIFYIIIRIMLWPRIERAIAWFVRLWPWQRRRTP